MWAKRGGCVQQSLHDGDGADRLGIYVSIPFCRSKCTYCNFASGVYPAADHARYVERVIEDLAGAGAWAAGLGAELPRRVDTVYLGGERRACWRRSCWQAVCRDARGVRVSTRTRKSPMECAPGQLADATPEAMAAVGVNRVSLGVQSFVDREAHASGRLHSRAIGRGGSAAAARGRNHEPQCGSDRGAGRADGRLMGRSLDALVDSGVPHASVYMLEVDEDSRLGREMLEGGSRYGAGLVPGDDTIARMYERAIERLEAGGAAAIRDLQFCSSGTRVAAQLAVLAAAAVSGRGAGCVVMPSVRSTLSAKTDAREGWGNRGSVLRATTTDDLQAYLAGTGIVETTWLAPARQHEEAWFLGLRMNAGVDVAALEREFGRTSWLRRR